MSRSQAVRAGTRLLVSLALLCLSSLLALVIGVGVFSWSVRARLERGLLILVQQEGVSAETFNIYYFGSSTMAGEPYRPEASIPRIVEELLDKKVLGRRMRSVNLGQVGADFAYSLERLRQVVRNKSVSHPSLAVIYAGHNEFLKYDGCTARLFMGLPPGYVELAERVDGLLSPLEIDQRRFLDVGVVGAQERLAVFERYRSELREAIALLTANDIPVIVSTLASNVADWEPNRSVFCGDKGMPEEFGRQVERGRDLESRGDLRAAIAAYNDALGICGSVAEIHYRMASCYRRLREPIQAWGEFQQALDEDGMPIRATSDINDFIRGVGDGRLVTTVDAVRRLRERSADGLIGFDLMIDAHHPNLKGYVLISELIAQEIRRRFPSVGDTVRTIDEAEAVTRFGIDQRKNFEVAVSSGRWFTRLATWRYDPRDRLSRAEAFFRQANELDPARYEPYVGLAMVQFLRGDAAGGESRVAFARKVNAEDVDSYFRGGWARRVRERAHEATATGRSVPLGQWR